MSIAKPPHKKCLRHIAETSRHAEGLKMPDQDRFEKTIGSGWKKAYRLPKGGMASEAEIADACITAIARHQ